MWKKGEHGVGRVIELPVRLVLQRFRQRPCGSAPRHRHRQHPMQCASCLGLAAGTAAATAAAGPWSSPSPVQQYACEWGQVAKRGRGPGPPSAILGSSLTGNLNAAACALWKAACRRSSSGRPLPYSMPHVAHVDTEKSRWGTAQGAARRGRVRWGEQVAGTCPIGATGRRPAGDG